MHYTTYICSMDRDSSVGIATNYGLDGQGIESRWGSRFSAPVQTGPGAHPALYTVGTGSLPGVKRPGGGVDRPSPSSAEVKERVNLYLYSPSGPSWPVVGWTLPLPLHIYIYMCVCVCVCVYVCVCVCIYIYISVESVAFSPLKKFWMRA